MCDFHIYSSFILCCVNMQWLQICRSWPWVVLSVLVQWAAHREGIPVMTPSLHPLVLAPRLHPSLKAHISIFRAYFLLSPHPSTIRFGLGWRQIGRWDKETCCTNTWPKHHISTWISVITHEFAHLIIYLYVCECISWWFNMHMQHDNQGNQHIHYFTWLPVLCVYGENLGSPFSAKFKYTV